MSRGVASPKPRRGRPPLGDRARTQVVTIKFSADELARIEAGAKREDTTVTGWIRDHALAPLVG